MHKTCLEEKKINYTQRVKSLSRHHYQAPKGMHSTSQSTDQGKKLTVLKRASGVVKVHYIFTEEKKNKVNCSAMLGGPMKSELTTSGK